MTEELIPFGLVDTITGDEVADFAELQSSEGMNALIQASRMNGGPISAEEAERVYEWALSVKRSACMLKIVLEGSAYVGFWPNSDIPRFWARKPDR